MGTSAFLIGELSWPMPDPGLIAVWRAMPIDASKWNDWGELDVGTHDGTVGALVDDMGGRLSIDDMGVNLRGRIEDAAAWQRLVIAWRAAADLGATGEIVCCAEAPEAGYKATIGEYSSRWAKLSAQDVAALGIARDPAKAAAREKSAKARSAKPAAAQSTATKSAQSTAAKSAKPAAVQSTAAKSAKPAAKAKPAAAKSAKPAAVQSTAAKSAKPAAKSKPAAAKSKPAAAKAKPAAAKLAVTKSAKRTAKLPAKKSASKKRR